MFNIKNFESLILSFKDKEIDTVIISQALSKYCNESIDVIKNIVSFKVLRGFSQNNEIIRGFINYNDMTASVELDYIEKRYIMKSLNKIYKKRANHF
ncbi:hypothetical protein [Intestinibacter sp.]|uniref:hypothetical protein n=1 Tax=Intestinibacter sp. TaxID=1965304 RepID=UPI002A91E712|nr:hypothetical protein [Intestinibacter sp.]MDY5213363.1 hypothetical protein [Intestinibacter sp.]